MRKVRTETEIIKHTHNTHLDRRSVVVGFSDPLLVLLLPRVTFRIRQVLLFLREAERVNFKSATIDGDDGNETTYQKRCSNNDMDSFCVARWEVDRVLCVTYFLNSERAQ